MHFKPLLCIISGHYARSHESTDAMIIHISLSLQLIELDDNHFDSTFLPNHQMIESINVRVM